MRNIEAVDCHLFVGDQVEIFDLVSDMGSYPRWWPAGVKGKVLENNPAKVGSKVEIVANGGKFRCELIGLEPPHRVQVHYYGGVIRGDSVWSLEELGDRQIKLCYEVQVVPHGVLPNLLGKVVDYTWFHSRSMRSVFRGLEAHLAARKMNP